MTIRTRLVLLLACLLAIFGAAAAGLRLTHHAEAQRILASLRDERSGLLDRLLTLNGQTLRNFASDYSLWDDMVAFVQKPEPAWAAINIDPSLPNFAVQAAWVARPDGSIIYTTSTTPGLGAPPFPNPDFLARLRQEKYLHFFQESPVGLLEMRTGPILPSGDLKRVTEPQGWFIVARLWDNQQLLRLSDILQSHASLAPAASPTEVFPPTLIHLERILPGWDGRTVRVLQVEYESPSLALLLSGNTEEAGTLYIFGLAVMILVVALLSRWVIRPLHLLSDSLETGDAGPLRELQRGSDEFGHLARQAAQSFMQRDALRDSEARLRQWMAVHDRLARDLHDGIIQSIYAAGLGLESARNLLQTDPAAAEKRLASCQRMFNDTLWQVRNFIQVIEPEIPHGQSPAQSLTALVANIQSLQPVPIISEIDPALAGRIRPQQEMHLLHMARELLSNSLRHSGAKQVRISLQAQPDGLARLEVSDNGSGFDPAAVHASGRGLANLAARARDLEARLEIDSAPGKGARIAVWFQPIN